MFSLNFKNRYLIQFITLAISVLLTNCSSDDAPPVPTGQSKQYDITNTDISDITGQVNFIENTNGSTTISINLVNTVNGINNVVRLRRKTANIGGGIFLNLNNINGEDGISITTVSKLDDGTPVSYEQFTELDGYLAIGSTGNDEDTLFAFSDLGPNELTGEKINYNLFSSDGAINGFAQFEERKKGTASLLVGIFDIEEVSELKCFLHVTSEDSTEEFIQELAPITIEEDFKGFGLNELTHINEELISYEDILQLNASIKISDATDATLFISQGGIGTDPNASTN